MGSPLHAPWRSGAPGRARQAEPSLKKRSLRTDQLPLVIHDDVQDGNVVELASETNDRHEVLLREPEAPVVGLVRLVPQLDNVRSEVRPTLVKDVL